MKKLVNAWFAIVATILLLGGVALQAQVYDFEDYNIGDPIDAIGWGTQVAEVADDPVATGNNVLKFTPNNYNAAPVLAFTLPAGKTLADYPAFKFKAYFQQGDVGWKSIVVEAYQTKPTLQFANVSGNAIGSWSRSAGASTAWEDITIDITNTSAFSGTIYIAFGINCAGTGDQGGSGLTTIWYADSVDLGVVVEPVTPVEADTVATWGFITGNTGWDFVPGTVDGDAGMIGTAAPSTWTGLNGVFEPITATTEKAIVVTGKIEFVGAGPTTWSPFRYALFNNDSTGNLLYAGTDSAKFSGRASLVYGYEVTPRSGTTDRISGNGGNGNLWSVNGGGFNSTWSSGKNVTMGVFDNAPARAEMTAGVYDWAFSVQPLGDSTNEVRFYIQKELAAGETQTSYYTGGTAIDTANVTATFNSIAFAINNNIPEGMTAVYVRSVYVSLGDPIEVPEAPWEPYYVDRWGILGARHGWKFVPGEFDGDAGMGGTTVPTTWEGLYGEFLQPLVATEEKAVIVTGKIEFLGAGPTTWSPFRYALFYNDSAKTLINAGTDSALFTGKANPVYGYEITPRSGTTDRISGNGGNGNLWAVNGGGYNSTWSGGKNVTMGVFDNAPARAEMTKGVYDWALSVQPLGDGTNEVRFYIQKQLATGETQTSFWIGGTAIDTFGVTTKFNAIAFSINNNVPAEMTGINVYEVQVDKGDPIEVTPKPWQPYYISDWGTAPGRWGGWRMQLGDFIGDVSMSGTPTRTNWAAVRGGFLDPLQITTEKAVIVRGKLEIVGDDLNVWGPVRYGFFYHDSIGVLKVDSTQAIVGTDTTYYNTTWSGQEKYAYGYMFSPNSGVNTGQSGQGGNGTQWAVNGGSWISTWSSGTKTMGDVLHAPARAIITEGTYDFEMSVQRLADGSNEVRYYFQKQYSGEQTTYWLGATFVDPTPVTDKINGFCLGFDNNMSETNCTGYNLTEIQVDYGDPITVTEKPWAAYYIDKWGFSGGNLGGWDLILGDFVGDVTIGGDAAPTAISAVRGQFLEPFVPTTENAIILTGKVKFTGGGFEDPGSLRFGLFNSKAAGSIAIDPALDSNQVWTGTDDEHSGYLCVPPSGSDVAHWTGYGYGGTSGSVYNSRWWDIDTAAAMPISPVRQEPAGAVAGAGEYNFAISVRPLPSGANEVCFKLTGSGYSYETGYVTLKVAEEFNSIGFAIDNSTTTRMELIEVQIDRGDPILTGIKDIEATKIPTVYALQQNFPNPFNPTTNIRFDLPKSSDVSLVVYDLMGHEVAQLVKGHMDAGYHRVNFNAANLPSGVYIYRLQAGSFVSVKKLMLIK